MRHSPHCMANWLLLRKFLPPHCGQKRKLCVMCPYCTALLNNINNGSGKCRQSRRDTKGRSCSKSAKLSHMTGEPEYSPMGLALVTGSDNCSADPKGTAPSTSQISLPATTHQYAFIARLTSPFLNITPSLCLKFVHFTGNLISY